jgi:hypothetical protein
LVGDHPAESAAAEAELLRCCARTRLDGRWSERVTAVLRGGMAWDSVLKAAGHHKMTGLVAWHLTGACADAVPAAVRSRLKAHGEWIARRNLALTGELLRLLHLFERQGISAVPYKGPILALRVYGNLAFRHSGDLDVLVRRQDVRAAKRLLLAEGYRLTHALSPAQEATVLGSEYVFEFVHPEKHIQWELHWDLARKLFSFPLESVHLWNRLEEFSVGEARIFAPSWEDQLLLLCVHGSKHCWDRLIWICDVAELLRGAFPAGLARALERARRLGALRMVLMGLALAHVVLDAELPEDVVRLVERDRAVGHLAQRVGARLFSHEPRSRTLFGQVRFHLRARERLRDRIRYCFRAMTTPTLQDVTWLDLPPVLAPLYLVARPARLLKKHLWRIQRPEQRS